jgi:hypothetical protein
MECGKDVGFNLYVSPPVIYWSQVFQRGWNCRNTEIQTGVESRGTWGSGVKGSRLEVKIWEVKVRNQRSRRTA